MKDIDPQKLSMVQLEHSYKEALAVSKRYKAELDLLKAEIERRIKPLVNDYGTFDRELDAVRMKIVKSKNISWDKDKLAELYEQIEQDGADPTLYIKKKEEYTIPENAYKGWSDELKKAFDPARTEKEPKITFEFVENTNA
jgi:hypothetical protein